MGPKHKLLLLIIGLISLTSFAQEVERKDVTALRIDQSIKVDGALDESAYRMAQLATDFVQLNPHNGQSSYQKTEVRILYDDDAIYIGAMLYDNPDSIASYITTRDNIGVSDFFVVMIDPNNEGLLSYEFFLTPANSQTDMKGMRGNGGDDEDGSWNAVWQSGTKILKNGWSAEIRIPYSAIRFPNVDEPVWGLNFFRKLRRYNSHNSWNFVNSEISGFIHQSGQLHGLKNIKPPVRLSVSPYVAEYMERGVGESESNFIFKGGLDLKYGLSESHTLDMMLVPDFGQIQSDDKVLNLSPYEIQYDEKRQFFNEGSDLFGRADIFYSKRIGADPKFSNRAEDDLKDNEEVTYNPTSTQLINATKITGRDKNGWGVGFLNAMTLPAKAKVENKQTGEKREIVTQPFTNYNISVIEKTIKNNSYVSIINSNVSMINDPYSANVMATQFQLKNNKQTYQVSGVAGFSHKSQADDKIGYGYNLEFNKLKGKFRFNGSRSVFSNTLDINDLGYLQRNNIIEHELKTSYNIHEPFFIFKSWYAQTWWENTRLFKPNNRISNEWNAWTEGTFKNNWWLGLYFGYNKGVDDYFEPRSSSTRFYQGPQHISTEMNFQSDSNKKLSWYFNMGCYESLDDEQYGNWMNTNLWWKVTQRFNISYNVNLNKDFFDKGWVGAEDDENIYFGIYDRRTIINTLSLEYTFNTKMAIDFRARHYFSIADYNEEYYFLNQNGSLRLDNRFIPEEDPNKNLSIFNVDMIFKWEFAPGSELSLSWKNDIDIASSVVNSTFANSFSDVFSASKNNTVSLKVLYYIDFNKLIK